MDLKISGKVVIVTGAAVGIGYEASGMLAREGAKVALTDIAEPEGRSVVDHVGEPDDVAYGILYLASEESKFVTGSELVIDGGYTAQ